jgi:hypothetical protein
MTVSATPARTLFNESEYCISAVDSGEFGIMSVYHSQLSSTLGYPCPTNHSLVTETLFIMNYRTEPITAIVL